LEYTQKLNSLNNHVAIINLHINKIIETENMNKNDRKTISDILNISGIVGDEKEKTWLLSHDWKGLLCDLNTKKLIEDKIHNKNQKERIGLILILKY